MMLCRKTFQTTENYKSDQIGRQNEQNDELRRKSFKTTQNYAKLRKWSNYNELHRFDIKTIQNVEIRRKSFKTAKLQKWSNYDEFASIWRPNDQKCWVTSQTIQNR